MKLELRGHNERYTVEQELLTLFPGELPVYGPIEDTDPSWAVAALEEDGDRCQVTVELCHRGNRGESRQEERLTGNAYAREGRRRHLIGRGFFLAARQAVGMAPPWGMLSGVRPDKLTARALRGGSTASQARELLERDYFVTPSRAALAAETGAAALRAEADLEPLDIAVYVGIPFCPTRCAYCSFVSQSVEKSFPLVSPYVEALVGEIQSGGALARRLGLRVRAFYMGGGTPTTLGAEQLRQVLDAFRQSFDTSACEEYTVEAGRPDTITADRMAVLRDWGVTRISVNPQSMEDRVLQAIGRRHTALDVERAMELAKAFPCVNMDLIAGLPEDTPEGFARTLERCLSFGPENLTVHTLSLKKGSRVLTEGIAIPDAASVGEMLDLAYPALRQGGYAPYYLYRQKYASGSFENTGWCRPETECRYNIYMMSELCGIFSFGAGGSTRLTDAGGRHIRRLVNPKYPAEYLQRPGLATAETAEAVEDFYAKYLLGGQDHE